MILASNFFKGAASSALELTEAELVTAEAVRVRGNCRAAIQLCRLCRAHVFCKSLSPELGSASPLWVSVLAPGAVLVLSCLELSVVFLLLLPLQLAPWDLASSV